MEEDVLMETKIFTMLRGEHRFFIAVHKILVGKGSGTFVAMPTMLFIKEAPRFTASAATEEEALNLCLKKIKDVPINELFPD